MLTANYYKTAILPTYVHKFMDSEVIIKGIGMRIRQLRKERNMTLVNLGDLCDMEKQAVQRLELGGTNPTIKTLVKIAKALNVHYTVLFHINDIES